MDINEIVNKTASLAKLSFNENELESFTHSFKNVLDYVVVINQLDLTGIEPLSQINDDDNCFREDIALPSITISEALKNAPNKNDNFYKVPKVIE